MARQPHPMSLEAVQKAAAEAQSARQKLENAVRKAAGSHSLRAVASAAGLSHEQVRRLTRAK